MRHRVLEWEQDNYDSATIIGEDLTEESAKLLCNITPIGYFRDYELMEEDKK